MRSQIMMATIVWFLASRPGLSQEKTPLTKHFVAGKVRVFYATEGKAAVPPEDANSNSVPDHVEDVAKQLWAAHQLFCTALEFPDPFESERYAGITCVELRIWDRTEIGGGNGVAFESAQRARTIPEGKRDDRALVMSIGKHVDARKNVTPAHEFFHLIQYSTTYFKNPWYLEGLARWSEHALGGDGVGQVKYSTRGPWPQKAENLSQLFKMSYDAEHVLWNSLAMRADRRGVIPRVQVPETLRNLRYSDGTPVLRDYKLHGAPLMRNVLIELGKADDIAFGKLGYRDWSEDNQRAAKNSPYIYEAIMNALRRQAPPVGRFSASTSERE
ncbi:MAG: hypothetical protein H8E66_18220 [Planctomycetes bacterium]|nr:hypothetical protein [Planctomycetota bacterium]